MYYDNDNTLSSPTEPTNANLTINPNLLTEMNISNENFEDEIQMQQIHNIYQLLNDDHLTPTDFLSQLKMYGVEIDNQTDVKLS